MTHLPYIVSAYGLTLAIVLWLGIGAWRRTSQARAKLAEIDPRGER